MGVFKICNFFVVEVEREFVLVECFGILLGV